MVFYKTFEIDNYGLPHFYELEGVHLVRGLSVFSKPMSDLQHEFRDEFMKGSESYLSYLERIDHFAGHEGKLVRHKFLIEHKISESMGYTGRLDPGYYPILGHYFQLPDELLVLYKLKYG